MVADEQRLLKITMPSAASIIHQPLIEGIKGGRPPFPTPCQHRNSLPSGLDGNPVASRLSGKVERRWDRHYFTSTTGTVTTLRTLLANEPSSRCAAAPAPWEPMMTE